MSQFAEKLSLLIAGVFIFGSRTCSGLGETDDNVEWWKTTLIYEIWPRFYQDSNADGHGDLQGIIDRLGYIKELGVETIDLGPIYPSPDFDCGYDVSDYKNVNSILGTIDDFDRLIEESHKRDIKVILDVIPDHTSDQHEWFNKSVNRIEPYTNYYQWENGTVTAHGTHVPPNNWMSTWHKKETSAWTWNDERAQWYYHRFQTSEPDLDFCFDGVRSAFAEILFFWLTHGVDGFRIYEVSLCRADYELYYESDNSESVRKFYPASNAEVLDDFRDAIKNWTKSNKASSKYVPDPDDVEVCILGMQRKTWDLHTVQEEEILLLAGSYEIMEKSSPFGKDVIPFNNEFSDYIGSSSWIYAFQLQNNIVARLDHGSVGNWPLSNEGNWRVASKVGSERLDALHMLSLLLPGQAFTLYGDEIGMTNTPSPTHGTDNSPINSCTSDDDKYFVKSPMQWDGTTSAGFSTKASLPLPVNENYTNNNVMGQQSDPQSHLNVYKRLAKLRKNPVFARGDWDLNLVNHQNVIVLRRSLADHPVYIVVINIGDNEEKVIMSLLHPDLNDNLDVVETAGWDETKRTVDRNELKLLSNAGIVLKSENKIKESPLPENEGKIEEKRIFIEMENTTEYVNETTQKIEMSTSESSEESKAPIEVTTILYTTVAKKDDTVSTVLRGETTTANSNETRASIEPSILSSETMTLGSEESNVGVVPTTLRSKTSSSDVPRTSFKLEIIFAILTLIALW